MTLCTSDVFSTTTKSTPFKATSAPNSSVMAEFASSTTFLRKVGLVHARATIRFPFSQVETESKNPIALVISCLETIFFSTSNWTNAWPRILYGVSGPSKSTARCSTTSRSSWTWSWTWSWVWLWSVWRCFFFSGRRITRIANALGWHSNMHAVLWWHHVLQTERNWGRTVSLSEWPIHK